MEKRAFRETAPMVLCFCSCGGSEPSNGSTYALIVWYSLQGKKPQRSRQEGRNGPKMCL